MKYFYIILLQVCNHPELFERRDAKSPVYISPYVYDIPYLIYDCNVRYLKSLIIGKNFLFTEEYIKNEFKNNIQNGIFSPLVLLGLSPEDIWKIFLGDILHR